MSSTAAQRPHPTTASLDAATLADAFQLTAARCADQIALSTRDGSQSLTWTQYRDRVRSVAAGLAALGVERGDTVALMLSNRPEFHVVDAATLHLGATPFSIYNTYPAEQVAHLLGNAGSRVVVTEQGMLSTILDAAGTVGAEHVVVVDGDGDQAAMTLAALERAGDMAFDFDAAWRAVEPGDVLTIIYTSGTTGPPKGVELTHANMLATVRAYAQVIDFPDEGRVVSWLPMAHIAERACSHYLPMVWGYATTCVADTREVIAALPEVRPTWFFAVPRIWEKLKTAIEASVAGETDPQRKAASEAAIATGLERTHLLQSGQMPSAELDARYAQLDALVLSKIRARLGLDQARSVNVGAAPTSRDVVEFFHALGIPLAELYGMSESCASGCVNPPGRVKIGTVGPPLPGFEIKLAEDGEVLLRGPGVMAGYRGEPDKTREALGEDGWLHTGDIGTIDEDSYLTIVDRKKELIINAAGKNMSPANIEGVLKSATPLIGHVVAIGDARPYNVALVTLDPDAARAFAAAHGISAGPPERLAQSEPVLAAISAAVERANGRLARVEQIKRFRLLPDEWQPGGDELTPTQKLKRRQIAEKYAEEIDALYR